MLLDNPFQSDARVEREIASLIKAGYTVTLFALQNQDLEEKEVIGRLTVYRILNPIIKSPLHRGYQGYLDKMTEQISMMKPGIVHCHDHHCLALGHELKKVDRSVKVVYDAHEFLPGWPLYKDISSFFNRFKGQVVYQKMVMQEKASIGSADAVITVSDSIAAEMIPEYKLAEKPLVLRNIPNRFKVVRSRYFHEHFAIPDEQKIIIHSGNIYHSNKRMKMLLQAIAENTSVSLVFIGDSHSVKEFERKTNQARVYFHPYPEQEAYQKLLGAADFGLVYTWKPEWKSHWLSLPNRIFEYSLAGLPIIGTEQPEFLTLGNEFGHIEFFRGSSARQFSQALQNALKNEQQLRENAKRISNNLSWELESKKLIALYQSL